MSLGPIIRIAYHVPGVHRRRQVVISGNGGATGGNDARELGIAVCGNEEVRRVIVRPEVPVVIDEVIATLSIRLTDADAIYLNGYNSWTDSVERPIMGRMWGLTRVPRSLVESQALDASGDYRFVKEDSRPGHQHGFGYGYVRQADEVLLFGSLDEDSGFTLIKEDAEMGTIVLSKEPPARMLAPGEEHEVISLATVGGTLEEAVSRWLKLMGRHARPARPVVGYCSWYRHFGNIDAQSLLSDLDGCHRVLDSLDLTGVDAVFLIDDGYTTVGDWLSCDDARFPEGVRHVAQAACERGLTPGLWLAPFVCERDSDLFEDHPEWVLRDERGDMVVAGTNWSGAYALDTRNDEVRAYVADVLKTVTRDWGFKFLKLDFLYSACLALHDGFNRGELMADALELLNQCVPADVRLLMCGVPLVSAFGRCEYCRVGQDVGLTWDGLPHVRLLQRERISTKLSLANARGRAHLDGHAFRCDPDVLFLREGDVMLSASQRVEMFVTDTSSGGVLFTSDDMGAWDEAQLTKYREAVARFRAYNGIA